MDACCFHCGARAVLPFSEGELRFCCAGCLAVFRFISHSGLSSYYTLGDKAGQKPQEVNDYGFLDDNDVQKSLRAITSGERARVSLSVPAIHCASCVFLLEQLPRFCSGVISAQVDLYERRLTLRFERGRVALSAIASQLAALGYPPDFSLATPGDQRDLREGHSLWRKAGVAGFCFANAMLFALPEYLGGDTLSPQFREIFAWANLFLALPVLGYAGVDYFVKAYAALKRRSVTMDVPIAVGMIALAIQSTYDVVTGHGAGYFDSLCALIFFLLLGRIFQHKHFSRLSFDRGLASFFPLAVLRQTASGLANTAVARLEPGDRIVIKPSGVVPVDCKVAEGEVLIDYSFATGENDLIAKRCGELVQAGGRVRGSAAAFIVEQRLHERLLVDMWKGEGDKPRLSWEQRLSSRMGQRFSAVVLCISLLALAYWLVVDATIALRVFASVLIVACPCALALASPVALGLAQRILAAGGLYCKNDAVVERLAAIDTLVFDKTGTLTDSRELALTFSRPFEEGERRRVLSLAFHSEHPLSQALFSQLHRGETPDGVEHFVEIAGKGVSGTVFGRRVCIGSLSWLKESFPARIDEINLTAQDFPSVGLAIADGDKPFVFIAPRFALRAGLDGLFARLRPAFNLFLLSGDAGTQRRVFSACIPEENLYFSQSPADKQRFIDALSVEGAHIAMVGDGLNDIGALKASAVGIAVADAHAAFPASDAVMQGDSVVELSHFLAFARSAVRVVRLSLLVSLCYNAVGIAIAVSGNLSPLIAALLMPTSSSSVIAFAAIALSRSAKNIRSGIKERNIKIQKKHTIQMEVPAWTL